MLYCSQIFFPQSDINTLIDFTKEIFNCLICNQHLSGYCVINEIYFLAKIT